LIKQRQQVLFLKGDHSMLIHVIFQNQSDGYLEDSRFDELLATFPIASFRRNDGWVRVGLDPIRSMATDSPPRPKGLERRQSCKVLKKAAKPSVATVHNRASGF
jgi:hypothetical protein